MLGLLLGGGSHGARRERRGLVYFVVVDVGQQRDLAALVVVERSVRDTGVVDRVTYERVIEIRQVVRRAETLPLGTPYPDLVKRVKALVQSEALEGRCTVAVDATGVGAPVVEMLKAAQLGCTVTGVVITSGDRARMERGEWRVPKSLLVHKLVMMLDQGELTIAGRMAGAAQLVAELAGMRVKVGRGGAEKLEGQGVHDDLVMALAMACWVMKGRERRDIFGTKNLGVYG